MNFVLKIAGIAGLMALLVACNSNQRGYGYQPAGYDQYENAYQGQLSEPLHLRFDKNFNIDSFQYQKLVSFIAKYKGNDSKQLYAYVPYGPYHQHLVSALAQKLNQANIGQIGIEIFPTQMGGYFGDVKLVFAYSNGRPSVASCEDSYNDVDESNAHYFGCSYRYNLSKMIANPDDLNFIREMGDVATNRRVTRNSGFETGDIKLEDFTTSGGNE